MRCFLKYIQSIYTSQPTNVMNVSGLIHGLIGWEVSICSSEPDKEEIEQFTTKHAAVISQYVTQPIQTQQFKKVGIIDG